VTAARSLAEYLGIRRAAIDTALEDALPRAPDCPAIIAEAMRYSLFAGGKRLRPILTLAAAETVAGIEPDTIAPDGPVGRAMPAACAIELIHTYSLIHDDLPAMDDDELRRGRPTAHVVFGEGLAILAGDGLLTEAFRVLAAPRHASPDHVLRQLRATRLVATAAGAEGMVGGQAIDLLAGGTAQEGTASSSSRRGAPLDHEALRAMHARKTGALIRAAAVSGAILAGADDAAVAAIDGYAAELGLAFQIVDDILDVEGSAEQIGKTAGKDAAAGKPTYPAMFGLEASRRLAAECIERASARLRAAGLGGRLPGLADWVVSRTR